MIIYYYNGIQWFQWLLFWDWLYYMSSLHLPAPHSSRFSPWLPKQKAKKTADLTRNGAEGGRIRNVFPIEMLSDSGLLMINWATISPRAAISHVTYSCFFFFTRPEASCCADCLLEDSHIHGSGWSQLATRSTRLIVYIFHYISPFHSPLHKSQF